MNQVKLNRGEAEKCLVDRILREREAGRGVIVVGIGAPSAAGKGHLIEGIRQHLLPIRSEVLELDRYYRGNAERARHGAKSFDEPAALDLDLAAMHIGYLKSGGYADVPVYDFPSGERIGAGRFDPCPVIIVDGLFALREPIVGLLDLKVFIETDPHSALLRRLFRDAGPAGRTKQSSRVVISQFFREVLPAQREHIDQTKDSADIIVTSRYDAASEADGAGVREVQLKFRGTLEAEFLRSIGASWIGSIHQTDRYLVPKDRDIRDEIVRLRNENGTEWIFTYKGPLIEGLPPNIRSRAKRDVEIAEEDARRFDDAYREVAVIHKTRRLYNWSGAMLIALDDIPGLGSFVEFHAPFMGGPDEPDPSPAALEEMARGFREEGANLHVISDSYLDLWLKRRP